ncbi:MAG: cysteine synthase family protein [Planctomycetales bacterium]|nr:cysteine synthase family protein [Planctomycetales bacterium]
MVGRPRSCTSRYAAQLAPTPLVPVTIDDATVWCKLEFLNPSGSTKDRIARYILDKAWRRGDLSEGQMVIEASSGSTSIAFALACAQMGLPFVAVMPESVSHERTIMIRAFGGQVRLTPKSEGIRGAIDETERMAAEHGGFLPRQFANPDNAEAHRLTTSREVLDQIPGHVVDAVVSGVGTGGTLVGMWSGFREQGCRCLPVLARPVNAAGTLSKTGYDVECCSFSDRIPGVADSLSRIFAEAELEGLRTIDVPAEAALQTARRLIRAGFPVGPSSGLNVEAALRIARELGPEARVVTVFPDRMERYFSTELFRDEANT